MPEEKKAATTEQELKQQQTHQDVERLKYLRDLHAVMSTPEGRRIMWKLIADTHAFHNPMTLKSLEMYWRAGKRDVGLRFYNDIQEAAPDLWVIAQKENVTTKEVTND